MANGNPFYINQGQGLAGLGANYIRSRDAAQMNRLREEAAQQKRDQIEQTKQRKISFIDALDAAEKSKNPADIARLHTEYPEFSQQVTAGQKYLSEATKQNAIKTLGTAYQKFKGGDVQGAIDDAQKRVKFLQESGGDPSDTLYMIDVLKNNPEKAESVMLHQLRADIGGDEAFLKSVGVTAPGRVQSSQIIPGLGVQTVDSSGNVAFNQLPEEDQKKIADFQAKKREAELTQLEEKELTKVNIKLLGETNKVISQEAGRARRTLPKLNDLEKTLSAIETGKLAEAKALIGPYLPDNLKPDDLADVQAAAAALNDFALTELGRFQGPTTDQELNFVRQVIANLGNTPEANRIIIDRMKTFLGDAIDEQNQFKEWRKAGGKDVNDFVYERSALPEVPAATQKPETTQQRQAPAAAIEALRNDPTLRDQFEAHYGYLPEGI